MPRPRPHPARAARRGSRAASSPGDGYTIEIGTYEAVPGPARAGARLPAGGARPAPGRRARAGHWMENARLEPDLQRFNARLARAGIVVLCYDPLGQGERRAGWHQHGQLAPLLVGFTSLGVMVAETLGGLDVLAARDDVDAAPARPSPARPAAASCRRSPPRSTTRVAAACDLLHPQHAPRRSCATPPTAPAGTAGSTSATRCRGSPRRPHGPRASARAAPRDVTVVHAVDDPPFPIAGARAVVAEAARASTPRRTGGRVGSSRCPAATGCTRPCATLRRPRWRRRSACPRRHPSARAAAGGGLAR